MIESHGAMRTSPKLTSIVGEFNRITSSERVPKHNGWLLTVLYTTRALDTTLSELIAFRGWVVGTPSLGNYLKKLRQQNIITAQEQTDFLRNLVDKRNRYMHEAGAMPSQLEANDILSEMHGCIALVLGKV